MQPSMLGKLKTSDPVRRDRAGDPASGRRDRRPVPRRVGDARRRRDHRLVGGRLPRALRVLALPSAPPHDARLPDGRQRGRRRRAAGRPGRARRRGRRARALRRGGGEARGARRAASCAATRSTRTRWPPGWRAATLVFHVAGINTLCPSDPAELFHVNVRGAEAAVRAAARAGVRRVVLTSSAARARRGRGHGGQRGLAAPRLVHVGLRALQARGRGGGVRGRPARRHRARLGQPVLGPGPGPRGRHRPDPDRLPQRPPEGVRGHAASAWSTSATASRATCWPPSAGRAGERYVLNGATLTSQRGARDRLRHDRRRRVGALPAARASPRPPATLIEGALPRARPHAAGLPRDGPHACCTATATTARKRRARARPDLHAGARDLPRARSNGRSSRGSSSVRCPEWRVHRTSSQ